MLSAIVLAAGKGKRFAAKASKVLSKIGNNSVIYYSLFTLNRHSGIKEIIVVASPENIKEVSAVIKSNRINKVKAVVLGGSRRQDSVFNGLKSLNADTDYVLVHDGARPFINRRIITSVVLAARKSGAAITGVPVKDTIKEVSGQVVTKTLKREGLWQIQTPQVFKKSLLLRAYKNKGALVATDDARLVEKLGARVSVILGSYNNIKITTLEDLIVAEAILKKGNSL